MAHEGGQPADAIKPAHHGARRRTLLVVTVATFVTPMASTMVGVALPQIGRDLAIGPATLGWVMTLYYLVFAVAVPVYGRWGDLADARRLFAVGLGLFALGSLVGALAPSYPLLLAGRVAQALGAAAVVGLGGALVARAYPPQQRGTALGTKAGIGAAALAASAPVGGVVTAYVGWHAIFVLSALAGLLAPYALRALPKHEGQHGERLDVVGATLLGLAVGGTLLALTEAARTVSATPVVLGATGGALMAAALLVVRQCQARNPLIPREVVHTRRYWLLAAIAFLVAAGDLIALTAVPLALVEVGNATAAQVGLVLLPGALLPIVLSPLAGRLVDRVGAAAPIGGGIVAMLLGSVLLSLTGGVSLGSTAALFAIQAVGIAVVGAPIIAAVSLAVPPRVLNTATGLTEMSFYLGAGVGTAVGTAVLAVRAAAAQAVNPLHGGAAPAYSDAFGVALLPLAAALALTIALGRRSKPVDSVVGAATHAVQKDA